MKKYISIVAILLCVVSNVFAQEAEQASLQEGLTKDDQRLRLISCGSDTSSPLPRSVSSLSGNFKITRGFFPGETSKEQEEREEEKNRFKQLDQAVQVLYHNVIFFRKAPSAYCRKCQALHLAEEHAAKEGQQ